MAPWPLNGSRAAAPRRSRRALRDCADAGPRAARTDRRRPSVRAQGRAGTRPQGRQEVRVVESTGAAGPGRDGPPRHLRVRTVPRTRDQARDALQVRRAPRANCAIRARRSSRSRPHLSPAAATPLIRTLNTAYSGGGTSVYFPTHVHAVGQILLRPVKVGVARADPGAEQPGNPAALLDPRPRLRRDPARHGENAFVVHPQGTLERSARGGRPRSAAAAHGRARSGPAPASATRGAGTPPAGRAPTGSARSRRGGPRIRRGGRRGSPARSRTRSRASRPREQVGPRSGRRPAAISSATGCGLTLYDGTRVRNRSPTSAAGPGDSSSARAGTHHGRQAARLSASTRRARTPAATGSCRAVVRPSLTRLR